MKKAILILVGFAVLAGVGYAAGQMLTKKNKQDNFVQLEDGRMMRMEGGSKEDGRFNREGERPDVIGKIKSIDGDKMVVEKFEMPSGGMGARRGGGGEVNEEQPTSSSDEPTARTKRPEPTVAGEETISFSEDTSFVKGSEGGRGRRGGGSENAELEDISKSDLSEGGMVSVWLSEDGIAERIMVR